MENIYKFSDYQPDLMVGDIIRPTDAPEEGWQMVRGFDPDGIAWSTPLTEDENKQFMQEYSKAMASNDKA